MTAIIRRTLLGTALTLAGLAMAPAPAMADRRVDNDHGRHDDNHDWDHDRGHDGDRDRSSVHINLDFRSGPVFERVPPPPRYEERSVRVWVDVDPVYRTVCEQVWVPAQYRTVTDRVWAPDQFEWRDVVTYDHGRRCVTRQQVLVASAHWEDCQRQALVCEGHYQFVERQVLVTPGHFETRVERVACG